MEDKSAADIFMEALPKFKKLPIEKQVNILWGFVGGLLIDTETLKKQHQAAIDSLMFYANKIDSIGFDNKIPKKSNSIIQSVIQEL